VAYSAQIAVIVIDGRARICNFYSLLFKLRAKFIVSENCRGTAARLLPPDHLARLISVLARASLELPPYVPPIEEPFHERPFFAS
jgi:hypothetical protein